MKILIMDGDTLVNSIQKTDNRFVFICLKDGRVFYTDGRENELFMTTRDEIAAGQDKLGRDHRIHLKFELGIE